MAYTFTAPATILRVADSPSNDIIVQIGSGKGMISLHYSLRTAPKAQALHRRKVLGSALIASPVLVHSLGIPVTAAIYATSFDSASLVLVLHTVHFGNTDYKFVNGDLALQPAQ